MDTLIYLDQNILSDLRPRKLDEKNDSCFTSLKNVLLSPNIQVVYSYITLDEINQILSDKYKMEHIEVLEELNAKYIEPEPNSKKLSDKKPSQIWTIYMGENSEDDRQGIKNLETTLENFSRKLSGLPIEDSFDEIDESFKDSLKDISKMCIDQLNSINENDLVEPLKSAIKQMKEQIPLLLNSPQKFNSLSRFDNQPLGPKPFREYAPIKNLNISELDSSEVVRAIENVFNQENSSWADNFDNSLENKISRAYYLMNWAGYYPDDFDKIKKERDRFRASKNDMLHAVLATKATFLISNDFAFCMKAVASYEYAGVNTIVCSPSIFLEKYCDNFQDQGTRLLF